MNRLQQNILVTTDSVFLDANILLEIVLGRSKQKQAREVLSKNAGKLYISALSAHLLVHFGKEIAELSILRQFLADYFVLPLESADFEWAFNNLRGKDFEDALQIAVCVRSGCGRFITFDKALYKKYKDLPMTTFELV